MVKCKFKKGDIISPLPNRYKSNDRSIRNIKKAKVLSVSNSHWRKQHTLYISITEGYSTHYGGRITKLNVFDDAFELAHKSESYEIF